MLWCRKRSLWLGVNRLDSHASHQPLDPLAIHRVAHGTQVLTHPQAISGGWHLQSSTFEQGTHGLSRPTRLTYTKGGTTLFDTDHHRYDGAGNIYEIGADRYTYDQTNRLTWGTVTQAGSRWETFTYDAFDNLTSGQKETSEVVQFPVNTSTNRYKGGSDDMVYDSTGNLVQLGAPTWTMAWDAFDMQTRFTSLAAPQSNHLYAYGPGDYRLVTLDTDRQEITYHLRDTDGTLLREYTLTGTGSAETWSRWEHEKDLVYGPEGALATVTRTGTQHFLHKDHLGSVRALSDGGGVLRGRHDFYPYGQETPRTGQVDEPSVKFTGHLRDAHGLSDYMLGRTCLWPLRRFASVDPGRDGWNLYAYVGNNPVVFNDPTGLFAGASNEELAAAHEAMTPEQRRQFSEAQIAALAVTGSVALAFAPGPEDAVLAVAGARFVARAAAKVGSFFRKLLKSDTPVDAAKVVTRTTRGGDPGVRITREDGSVIDITPDRVKEFVAEPRAKKGLRPVKFDDAILGSKGKKREPTNEELELLQSLNRD